MKLIITIPAYNEEKTIDKVIKEIPRQIDGIKTVEVLVINDGSTDNTVTVAKKCRCRLDHYSKNQPWSCFCI